MQSPGLPVMGGWINYEGGDNRILNLFCEFKKKEEIMNTNAVKRICQILTIALAVTFLIGSIAPSLNAEQKEMININTADVKEMMKLPGIGKKKAEDIIAFRQENGGFNDVSDLKKIDGIGKKTFEKIKERIVTK
jgi:competence protein ComEA